MTFADLVGGTIRLMPKEGTRELDVCCALSTTRFGSHSYRAASLLLGAQKG